MTTNKIIRKHFIMSYVITGTILALLASGTFFSVKNDIKEKKSKTQKVVSVAFFSTISCAIALCILLPVFDAYYNANKYSESIAHKYLKQSMKEYPELKKFEHLLHNPKYVNTIANIVSYNLPDAESKKIYDIVNHIHDEEYKTDRQRLAQINDARNQIIMVIKQFSDENPEFVKFVYATMLYADKTYIIPAKQREQNVK